MLKAENSIAVFIDFQEKLMPVITESAELERMAAVFAGGCTLLEIPILLTQQYTKGLGNTVASLKGISGEYIEKITFSCCGNETFIRELNRLNRKNIVVAGIEAHICVQQTVLDLLDRGFNVYVVTDCIGSRYDKDRICAEERMRQSGAVLTTAESVLFEWLERADNPKRKEISALITKPL